LGHPQRGAPAEGLGIVVLGTWRIRPQELNCAESHVLKGRCEKLANSRDDCSWQVASANLPGGFEFEDFRFIILLGFDSGRFAPQESLSVTYSHIC